MKKKWVLVEQTTNDNDSGGLWKTERVFDWEAVKKLEPKDGAFASKDDAKKEK